MTQQFVYFREDGFFIGWMEEFPDYPTQGETLNELKANLNEIYGDLTSGVVPGAK